MADIKGELKVELPNTLFNEPVKRPSSPIREDKPRPITIPIKEDK